MAKGATKAGGSRLADMIRRRQTGLFEDIFLFAATLLVCAFYQMENYRLDVSNIKSMPDLSGLPAVFGPPAAWLLTYGMQLFRAGFAVLFIATLIVLSFSNGVLRRWGFISAVAALLLLPQLGLALLGAVRYGDGLLRFLYELSVMLGQWPFIMQQKLLTYVFPVGLPTIAALAFGTSVLMFALGALAAGSKTKDAL